MSEDILKTILKGFSVSCSKNPNTLNFLNQNFNFDQETLDSLKNIDFLKKNDELVPEEEKQIEIIEEEKQIEIEEEKQIEKEEEKKCLEEIKKPENQNNDEFNMEKKDHITIIDKNFIPNFPTKMG